LHATDKPKEDSIRVAHIPRIVALRHEIRADASKHQARNQNRAGTTARGFTKLGRHASTPARIKEASLELPLAEIRDRSESRQVTCSDHHEVRTLQRCLGDPARRADVAR
jgi:hypothetical protein